MNVIAPIYADMGEYGAKTTAQVVGVSFNAGNVTIAVFLVLDLKGGKSNMTKKKLAGRPVWSLDCNLGQHPTRRKQ